MTHRAARRIEEARRETLESAERIFGRAVLDMVGAEWVDAVASSAFLFGYHGDDLDRAYRVCGSAAVEALGGLVFVSAGEAWLRSVIPGLYRSGAETSADDRTEAMMLDGAGYTDAAAISS